MKKLLLLAMFAFITAASFSQKSDVKWYSIQEVEKLLKQSPRPVFVDTYTDWCGWCKKMDQETFSHSVIADILNNRFYPVKFNA